MCETLDEIQVIQLANLIRKKRAQRETNQIIMAQ